MSKHRLFLFLIIVSSIISCTSKKSILYMQDIDATKIYLKDYEQYKVKVDDILKIDVNSGNPETSLIFKLENTETTNKDAIIYSGYQVNLEGNIFFPILGEIKVVGKGLNEIRDYIYTTIKQEGILVEPHVDVKLINGYFTIIGEVNKPGRYEFLENNMNILEAIGMAGDLTINGERKNIKLIRDNNGEKYINSIDLTKSNILIAENFQIYPGDIIIVDPNNTRVKNAGIIGNSGTLLSLLSFILSSIIVISN